MSSSNRRAHSRLPLTAEGWIAATPDGDWNPIRTVDVSKGGFAFVSKKKIAIDAIHQFRLQLPNDAGLMHVEGRIAHCFDLSDIGVYRIGVQAMSVDVIDVEAMLAQPALAQQMPQCDPQSLDASGATVESADSIHAFWFGNQADDAAVAAEKAKLWWAKDAATDAMMLQRFAPALDLAASGALADWAATPQGRLALILLADQFPRNMYRDTPKAFSYDSLARSWCRDGLDLGIDRLLRPIERVFFYLPLEHSESLADQNLAVSLFERLVQDVPPEQRTVFAGFHDFAVRHRVIIERFQRFPHRNAILGRPSTAEEAAFLQEKGSSF